MRITFVGTASGSAAADRAPSCLFIETNSGNFLVDAGDGTAREFVRLGISHDSIGHIFISHTHPDHAAGLFTLLQQMFLSGRTDPLTVYLPASAAEKMDDALSVFWIEKNSWPFEIRFIRLTERKCVHIEEFEILSVINGHLPARGESLSFILRDKDRRCLYTSDVDCLDHFHEFGSQLDLLITECSHISVIESVRFAQKYGIPKIVVTHIPNKMDIASVMKNTEIENSTVVFASDGDIVTV